MHHEVRSEKWRDSLHSFLSHDHLRCNDNDGDDNDDDVEHIPAARVPTNLICCKCAKVPFCFCLGQPQWKKMVYTFSYRKALFRPQIVPKIANWGLRAVKIAKSKKYARTEKKVFIECKRQNVLRAVEK